MSDIAEVIPGDVKNILGQLEGVKPGANDHSWTALCPAHDDRNPSLSVGVGNNGKLLMFCHAGCSFEDIINALYGEELELDKSKVIKLETKRTAAAKLETTQAEPGGKVTRMRAQNKLTLRQLAAAKKLPATFLRDNCRVRDRGWGTGVNIRYLDFKGAESTTRLRIALKGKDRFRWPKGTKIDNLYGEWRLRDDLKKTGGVLFLVEGESDCWTLWFHGFAALGFPGAAMFDRLRSDHLKAVKKVIISREPGKASANFAAGLIGQLRRLNFHGGVRQVNHPRHAKDFSAVHIKGGKLDASSR